MQSRRRQQTNPTAILSADIHLRPDIPIARIDDYTSAMKRKIKFILDLVLKYQCPLLVAGDLGNKPGDKENKINDNAWPSWLLEWIITEFRNIADEVWPVVCIPGQHDLPNHQLSLWKRSGIGVLSAAKAIEVIGIETHFPEKNFINKFNFGIIPFPYSIPIKDLGYRTKYQIPDFPLVAMTHQMVIQDKELWPDQNAPTGHKLLDEFPEYNLILSGDNHQSFICEKDRRFLVNPGSMMRNTIAQIDHKPRVYLWYAEEKRVEPVFLPIEDNVFDLNYIEKNEHDKINDKRFDSLITTVKNTVELGIKFEDNMEKYLEQNRQEKLVTEKIWANVK